MKTSSILIPLSLATQLLANPVNVKAGRNAEPISTEGLFEAVGGGVEDATNSVNNVVKAADGAGLSGVTLGGPNGFLVVGGGGLGKRVPEAHKQRVGLVSRNPAMDLAVRQGPDFDFPLKLCLAGCAGTSLVCNIVGITIGVLLGDFIGLFPTSSNKCNNLFCDCEDACQPLDEPLEYFCYEKNGGEFDDEFENCDKKCCDENCPDPAPAPEPPKEEDPVEEDECTDDEIFLGLCF